MINLPAVLRVCIPVLTKLHWLATDIVTPFIRTEIRNLSTLAPDSSNCRAVSVRNPTWFSDAAPCVRLSSLIPMEDCHGKTQGQQGVVGGADG